MSVDCETFNFGIVSFLSFCRQFCVYGCYISGKKYTILEIVIDNLRNANHAHSVKRIGEIGELNLIKRLNFSYFTA